MKILINDVKGKIELIKNISTLNELKELCIKHNLTLIEVWDDKYIKTLEKKVQETEFERFKCCDIILTEHNDYIE